MWVKGPWGGSGPKLSGDDCNILIQVVIFCGKKAEEVTITGDKLDDQKKLEQLGYSLKKPYMIKDVKESFEKHIKR